MNTQELRKEIIDKVNQLDENEVLLSLKNLLSMSNTNLANFLKIANENLQNEHFSETEDFSGYIKEWVKSM
jgi:uncharacterized protein YehS (DUF1456 family)